MELEVCTILIRKNNNLKGSFRTEKTNRYSSAYNNNTDSFLLSDKTPQANSHEVGHKVKNTNGNNLDLSIINKNGRENFDKSYDKHDKRLDEFEADIFAVQNDMLNSGIWDGKSRITQKQINQYKNMLKKQNDTKAGKRSKNYKETSDPYKYNLNSGNRFFHTTKDDYEEEALNSEYNANKH